MPRFSNGGSGGRFTQIVVSTCKLTSALVRQKLVWVWFSMCDCEFCALYKDSCILEFTLGLGIVSALGSPSSSDRGEVSLYNLPA